MHGVRINQWYGASLGKTEEASTLPGNIRAARNKRKINAFGCGLSHTIAKAPKDAQFDIWLSIITPFVPIQSFECVSFKLWNVGNDEPCVNQFVS